MYQSLNINLFGGKKNPILGKNRSTRQGTVEAVPSVTQALYVSLRYSRSVRAGFSLNHLPTGLPYACAQVRA